MLRVLEGSPFCKKEFQKLSVKLRFYTQFLESILSFIREILFHRLKIALPPALFVLLSLTIGNVRVQQGHASTAFDLFEQDFEPRVGAAGRKFGRAPGLDYTPVRLKLDRLTLDVPVPGGVLSPQPRFYRGLASGEGAVLFAVQPGLVDTSGAGRQHGRDFD